MADTISILVTQGSSSGCNVRAKVVLSGISPGDSLSEMTSTRITTTTSSSGSGKVVRFEDKVTTILLEPELCHVKDKWYRKRDFKSFQEEKKETLRHFKQCQAKFQRIEEDTYCLRGFEAFLSARAVQQKLLRRLSATQTVLESQHRQRRKHGIADPAIIQLEYYRVTATSRQQAKERAAMDAKEVLGVDQCDQKSSSSPSRETEMAAMKAVFGGFLDVPSGPTLRSATSGPLRLRKTVPNTA